MLKRRIAVAQLTAVVALLSTMTLTGCVTVRPASPEEAAKLNCEPLPTDYQAMIQTYMNGQLIDPESARYQFYVPAKAKYEGGCAWYMRADINAKNSYGGYTGAKIYFFVISHGQIEEVNTMASTFIND